MSTKQIAFGVGCFHFGYHPPMGTKFNGSDYVAALKAALSKISNIEKIEIQAEDDFLTDDFEVKKIIKEMGEGCNFFPYSQSAVNITLSLFIPKRVQEELSREKYLETGTCERFIVNIIYTFHFPFTTIRAVNAEPEFEPSDGVYWCRKFFEKCFAEQKDSLIRFESIGPSPFHADFFLEPHKTEITKLFEYERIPERGYDSCYFRYNSKLYESIEEAYDFLIYHLDEQFSLFYHIVHERMQRDDDWITIYNSIQNIIENQQKKGAKAFWNNTLHSEDALHDAIIQLAQIEASDLDTRYNLKRYLKGLHMGAKPPELMFFLEEAFADFSTIPFQQMREILNQLEARRTKNLRLVMMALSAVLGGATGAWLTLLLKKVG